MCQSHWKFHSFGEFSNASFLSMHLSSSVISGAEGEAVEFAVTEQGVDLASVTVKALDSQGVGRENSI